MVAFERGDWWQAHGMLRCSVTLRGRRRTSPYYKVVLRTTNVKMNTHHTNSCLPCQQLTEAGATGMQQCLPYTVDIHAPNMTHVYICRKTLLHPKREIIKRFPSATQATVSIQQGRHQCDRAMSCIYRQFSWLIVFYKVLCVLAFYRLS